MPKMLTAWTPGNARTDVVWVGGLFKASIDQLVFELGLYVYPGNSGAADVYLVDQINGNIIAQVSINMSGAQSPLGFVYASLSSPVTMMGGRAYALSAYSAQMAKWSNTAPISTTTDFAAIDQCYSTSGPGGIYVDYGSPGSMYVGCDLVYGAPESPPNISPNLVMIPN
jgi:hypothetical protein